MEHGARIERHVAGCACVARTARLTVTGSRIVDPLGTSRFVRRSQVEASPFPFQIRKARAGHNMICEWRDLLRQIVCVGVSQAPDDRSSVVL